MDNNTNDDSNIGGNDNRGKFTDRLKKIRKDRLLRKKNIISDEIEDEHFIITGGRNILKIFLAIPSIVYTVVKPVNIKKSKKSLEISSKEKMQEKLLSKNILNERKYKIKEIKDIDINLLKKTKEKYYKKTNVSYTGKSNLNQDNLEQLQKEIINLIKKKLVKNLNELEILQGELYLLKELDSEDVYFNECINDIKEIKKLLSKVKSLKEKYDYLKDNVDFEYMLEYDDNFLMNKILELKELYLSDEIKYVVDNYKILDEYKFLYLKIDKLQENVIKYDEYKNSKVVELKQRDIDFDKLKNDIYFFDRDKERYESFVKEQELLLKKLDEKLLVIDSHEENTYRLKGFNKLLGNSFKYIGLLLASPLKGLIPGIATQTIITKNLIHNLYNNLEWKEEKKTVYETIDYSLTINNAINDLNDTSSLIDATLEDVINLKNKYISSFKKYENDVYGYKDAIKKINKIENSMLSAKVKMDMMKQKMIEKEKQNKNKMIKIRKLVK